MGFPAHHNFTNSSSLRSCTYDEDTQDLTITFMSGQPYTYAKVPRDVFEQLTEAQSPGSFFHQNIKGVYG